MALELTAFYPVLIFIALVLLGLAAYFKKRASSTRVVNRDAINEILKVNTSIKEAKKQEEVQKEVLPLSEALQEGKSWSVVTLFENTPEQIAKVKVLITLIRQDSDGKLRASLSYYDKLGVESDFRISEGDLVNINGYPCKVEKITFVENNRGNVKIKIKANN